MYRRLRGGKNIYGKGNFLTETFWLDDKSYFWYYSGHTDSVIGITVSCVLVTVSLFVVAVTKKLSVCSTPGEILEKNKEIYYKHG